MEKAKRGIQVTGEVKGNIGCLIEGIINAEGAKKIILLLEVLMAIEKCSDAILLTSISFQHNFLEHEKDRIDAIYNYSISHFKSQITLEEIAAVSNLSPNSFCRFFKTKTRKTYTMFLNEIRVGNACKLLIEDKINVKQICYESGFNNFASFHKFFKLITGKSPLSFQKEFLSKTRQHVLPEMV